ncbi:antitoxin Xre/MbcA/ParS toxin-binding domain-containing protein [Massilia putida]|uniref:antitoxin Xre/MbcA/ParS toxin-binding domain-containing protein n=1 Tax=Massilia TaxID=149698 RepID=UPI0009EA1D31
MRVRSRKTQLYSYSFHYSAPNGQKKRLKMLGLLSEWHAIEPSIVRALGCDKRSALNWFIAPAIGLGGRRPVDLAKSANVQILLDYLTRVEFGVYT